MQREGYRVTAEFEEGHWWFRSRRDLFLAQVARAARELGEPGRELRILDYGCGTGFNLGVLARFGAVRGADVPNPEAAEFEVAAPSAGPRIDLGSDVSEHHESFDIVTALDVIEHMDDDVAGLAGIGRLLVPGGQLVLTVPAFAWLWSGEDVISEHRRRYTRPQLLRACVDAGFEVRFASYFNLAILPAVAAAVFVRRIFARGAPPRSNLSSAPPLVNELLYRVTAWEARGVGAERWRPPAGASLVCRCVRRRDQGSREEPARGPTSQWARASSS